MGGCGAVLASTVGCTSELSAKTKFAIAKWYYLVCFILTATATWVLRDYADVFFAGISSSICDNSANAGICGGQEVAMRISFANFCWFALHCVLCLFLTKEDDFLHRVDIHGGLWLWKTIVWMGALVGFFFVPSSALYGYAQFARIGSGFYLILQLILLIDLIYRINEWLVERESKAAWVVLSVGSFCCFGLGLVLIGFSYHFYAPRASCSLNIFFITWSIVIMLVLIGIIFIPNKAPTAGLLTSGAVFLYCSFLLYSSLNSEPSDNSCVEKASNSKWIQIVGFFIAIATVIYSTFTAGLSSNDMFGKRDAADSDGDSLPYRADWFHFIFALASMYIAMLFSQWEVSPSTSAFELDQGWISTWVKIVSKWVCELLYIWTVIAPALFPGREFGYRA